METLLDLAKAIGGPAAAMLTCMMVALRWFKDREQKCDDRFQKLQEAHTAYIETQTQTVTAALVDNSHSNREIAQATRELTQSLSGKFPTVPTR